VHFFGLFLSSLLKMHGPKNKIVEYVTLKTGCKIYKYCGKQL